MDLELEFEELKDWRSNQDILRSWCKTYWERGIPTPRDYMLRSVFNQVHPQLVERILDDSEVLVAKLEGASVGALVHQFGIPPRIHWVWVAKAFRRLGIAHALFNRMGLNPDIDSFSASHLTKDVKRVLNHPYRILYVPFSYQRYSDDGTRD